MTDRSLRVFFCDQSGVTGWPTPEDFYDTYCEWRTWSLSTDQPTKFCGAKELGGNHESGAGEDDKRVPELRRQSGIQNSTADFFSVERAVFFTHTVVTNVQ